MFLAKLLLIFMTIFNSNYGFSQEISDTKNCNLSVLNENLVPIVGIFGGYNQKFPENEDETNSLSR
jgi:hypothetical protein